MGSGIARIATLALVVSLLACSKPSGGADVIPSEETEVAPDVSTQEILETRSDAIPDQASDTGLDSVPGPELEVRDATPDLQLAEIGPETAGEAPQEQGEEQQSEPLEVTADLTTESLTPGCQSDEDCRAPQPKCNMAGECVECLSDEDCPSEPGSFPYCTIGFIRTCTTTGCRDDADCVASPLGPKCEPTFFPSFAPEGLPPSTCSCTNSGECTTAPYTACFMPHLSGADFLYPKTCQHPCDVEHPCEWGVCESSSGMCVECVTDDDCANVPTSCWPPGCVVLPFGPYCDHSDWWCGFHKPCAMDTECQAIPGWICNASGVCAAP
jgi:hypothetical protein